MTRFALPAALALALLASPAFAGSPLICWPVDTGGAETLPFGDDVMQRSPKYDVARLVDDVAARLAPSTPVLVRMETLRRATLYAADHRDAAPKLLAMLTSRALDAEAKGQPDALAWFDAGYLASCFAEIGLDDAPKNGLRWIEKASALRGGDAEMEFAAYLVTLIHGESLAKQRARHLKAAALGAKEGSLLAKNLLERVGGEGAKSLAALRAAAAAEPDGGGH